MSILVIGYGVSGKAATRFLRARGESVVVVDRKAEGVGRDTEDFCLDGFQQVVLSPGVPPTHPLIQKALGQGIEVIGEMELGFRHLTQRSFGITGSNGKTTTVLLTTHILNSAGKKAKALGNIGEPLTHYLCEADRDEIFILELSSFQLETLRAERLEAAVILNVTPNHLDRHPSMRAYAEAKAAIQQCLLPGAPCFVSAQVKGEFGDLFSRAEIFEKPVALIDELSYTTWEMPSKQSVQAAYLLCKRCGVTDVEFLKGLQSYRKPAHRIEWVAEIEGVLYYNDSKSSNVHSVMHAVERMNGPVILIAGGVHKGSSYRPWIENFKGKVKLVIAYGQAAPLIACELKSHIPLVEAPLFAEAVQRAKIEAKKTDIVLLSPGCSSYDQFSSYEERGDQFKRLVREL